MKIAPNIFPRPLPALKLALTGATVGPLVDSLHNQCLLEYKKAMVDIPGGVFVSSSEIMQMDDPFYILRTSWYIPPLLGIAYLVLGAILPRLVALLLDKVGTTANSKGESASSLFEAPLQTKAIIAVSTTALIIKLSEFLETSSPFSSSEMNLFVITAAALTQWGLLDGTVTSLITALVVSIGGPLSELPFVAAGFWQYLPQASDYFPLKDLDWDILNKLLGDDYQDLALSSITGPCYFAVTMDAIALGRWFDADGDTDDSTI